MDCKMKDIKDCLVSLVCEQMNNIEKADYLEVGATIDMIKDLAEAMYYCEVTKAMQEKTEHTETIAKI